MSNYQSSSGQPVPHGILVAKKVEKAERPTPRRKPGGNERQIPWMWIAVGGSFGWVALVLVVAFLTFGQEQTLREEDRIAARPLAVDGILPEPVAPAAVVPVKADIPEMDVGPAPVPPARRLVRPEPVIKGVDLPPPVIVRDVRPDVPAAEPAPMPDEQKPARKKVDTKIFANCEQIGTDVLFVRDPPEAFKRAREERKMVFMVHLSGNLEDPGFT